jgi:hypothetical protein
MIMPAGSWLINTSITVRGCKAQFNANPCHRIEASPWRILGGLSQLFEFNPLRIIVGGHAARLNIVCIRISAA